MDSKSPTNWIDLPMEMRVECVKKMDFESRMMLRDTSHTEKLIVESAPMIHFHSIEISLWDSTSIKYQRVESEEMLMKHLSPASKDCQLVAQILKLTVIDHFALYAVRPDFYQKFILASKGPYRMKSVKLDTRSPKIADHFLKNCEGVEKIVLMRPFQRDLASYPSVVNAKNVDLQFSGDPYCLCELIKKWIENDVEIGKSLEIRLSRHKGLQFHSSLVSKFANRVHYRDLQLYRSKLCLRMDNDSKHIRIEEHYFYKYARYYNYSVTVVASSEVH